MAEIWEHLAFQKQAFVVVVIIIGATLIFLFPVSLCSRKRSTVKITLEKSRVECIHSTRTKYTYGTAVYNRYAYMRMNCDESIGFTRLISHPFFYICAVFTALNYVNLAINETKRRVWG